MHKRTLEDLRSRQAKPRKDSSYVPKLFESIIYQRDASSNIADFCQTINTVKKKYGDNFNDYKNLTLEFMSRSNL